MQRTTLVMAASGAGLVLAPWTLAGTVNARFAGGGVTVNTSAEAPGGQPDDDVNSTNATDVLIDADGVSTSGLVSSAGSFSGAIEDVTPESPFDGPFTQLSFLADLTLSQPEPGGTAFAGVNTSQFNDPAPILLELDEAARFSFSLDAFGDFDEEDFEFDFRPIGDTGAGFDGDVLLPGTYEIEFRLSLFLNENELQKSAGFEFLLLLDSDVEPIIPLPGPAGLALLGVGAVALRRRRSA